MDQTTETRSYPATAHCACARNLAGSSLAKEQAT
ncbi:hypothetical protein PSYJA_23468 [Pseudomonas syringae pv. japonica str. M301072]|uniref:Uncharacterized protein n=1 Tax=Pseudomonas syringae pv. japonica str. M301072 TaxID=629262 RepID=F3FNI2_PSESX|nr:hypothetical protein PSYJA_23468 [Pseudomonas syringae pv. japonica str. M301072]